MWHYLNNSSFSLLINVFYLFFCTSWHHTADMKNNTFPFITLASVYGCSFWNRLHSSRAMSFIAKGIGRIWYPRTGVMVVSYHEVAGNQIQALCMSSQCSKPASLASAPHRWRFHSIRLLFLYATTTNSAGGGDLKAVKKNQQLGQELESWLGVYSTCCPGRAQVQLPAPTSAGSQQL